MRLPDLLRLSLGALTHQPARSLLSALGIAVGVTAVILLTALGEGLHQFVLGEFTQFGTNLIAVTPGKTKTHGGTVGMFGIVRPLSLEDAVALRQVPQVQSVCPVVQGNAEVLALGRGRRVTVYGVGPEFPQTYRATIAAGRFLPPDDLRSPRAFAVLGAKVRNELFGAENPLGVLIRVGGQRYRVIGVMAVKGQVLGFDLDDTVYLPTARVLELFNRVGLMEIDVAHDPEANPEHVQASLQRLLKARHGSDDFTVTERTGEIGLLNALGARHGQIMALFLAEAAGLAALGGAAGLGLGVGTAQFLHFVVPALPVRLAWDYILAAEAIAVFIGLAAGVAPARRAARFDPVEALRAE